MATKLSSDEKNSDVRQALNDLQH